MLLRRPDINQLRSLGNAGKDEVGEVLSHNMQLAYDSLRIMHVQAITVNSFSDVSRYRCLVEY